VIPIPSAPKTAFERGHDAIMALQGQLRCLQGIYGGQRAQIAIRLFFWHLMSCQCSGQDSPRAASDRFIVPAEYRFASVVARLSHQPNALHSAMQALCDSQADPWLWHNTLHPEWTTAIRPYWGGREQLARHIAAIDCDQVTRDGSMPAGRWLGEMARRMGLDDSTPNQPHVAIIEHLMALRPDETLIDTACGSGQLLATLSLRSAGNHATCTGFEADPAMAELANMLLAAYRLPSVRLVPLPVQHAIAMPDPAQPVHGADCVLAVMLQGCMAWRAAPTWHPTQSASAHLLPARLPPITDGRIGHAWAALALMQPGTGRAIWMWPLELFDSDQAAGLLQWLLAHNLLDALIELPFAYWVKMQTESWLLILRQQRIRRSIAYIASELASELASEWTNEANTEPDSQPARAMRWRHDTIHVAHAAWQRGATHPFCWPMLPLDAINRLRRKQQKLPRQPLPQRCFTDQPH
jgi:hypothetical protein